MTTLMEYTEYRITAEDGKVIFTAQGAIPQGLSKEMTEKVDLFLKSYFSKAAELCGKERLENYRLSNDRLKRLHTPSIVVQAWADQKISDQSEEVLLRCTVRLGTKTVHSFKYSLGYDSKRRLFLPCE